MGHQRPSFETIGGERPSRWVITCDHATNLVPECIGGGDLGLPPKDMSRHIAYDIGAEGVSLALGDQLDAPVIATRFSRLVIDPNRGEDDPTLLMRLYDGTIIPANRHADDREKARRLDAFYRPYHGAIGQLMSARRDPVLLAIHSYTPQLAGRPLRPWQIGVLTAADRRLGDAVIAALNAPDFAQWVADISGTPLAIGDNQPYSGHLPGDSVDRHALSQGHHNVLIEIRNDLIATPTQQRDWARKLAPLLARALHDADLADPLPLMPVGASQP